MMIVLVVDDSKLLVEVPKSIPFDHYCVSLVDERSDIMVLTFQSNRTVLSAIGFDSPFEECRKLIFFFFIFAFTFDFSLM